MPFSHHSHSHQFCSHASDTSSLEQMITAAIDKGMEVFCLTEHMPRDFESELYPEEKSAGMTMSDTHRTFDNFVVEARRLQALYAGYLTILVGTESEWIDTRKSAKQSVEQTLSKSKLDFFVGSVHHVHGVPIDYSQDMYLEAGRVAMAKARLLPELQGLIDTQQLTAEELLFGDYFDAQYEMLQALRPPVVGHFDLIRLYSAHERQAKAGEPGMRLYDRVWRKIVRNLDFIKDYGGLLELNSSALRKGLPEPYPSKAVCEQGGTFVLSDDSHAISHIGTQYENLVYYMRGVGIEKVSVLGHGQEGQPERDARFPNLTAHEVTMAEVKRAKFFQVLTVNWESLEGVEEKEVTA